MQGVIQQGATIFLMKTGDEKCDHMVTETFFITSFH
jgi:hypothetical protein